MNSNIFVCQAILRKFQLVIGLFFVFSLSATVESIAQGSQIIYVKKGAPAPGDGLSWATAYPDLQQALTAATTLPGSKEIWVAQGEYKPTATLDRTISFVLPANTTLYGGFVGNETSLSNRNWRVNRTILSGDIGAQFVKSDNSAHVVTLSNVSDATTIDGFVIKEGNASATSSVIGGGILVTNTSATTNPRIVNCELSQNNAAIGGGLGITSGSENLSSPTIINCQFNGNTASLGAAVAIVENNGLNSPTFINCSFTSNISNSSSTIWNFGRTSLINCTLTLNRNVSSAINSESHLQIYNSIIWKNYSGSPDSPEYEDPISIGSGTYEIQNNIIQGDFGNEPDENLNVDPLFETDPSFIGKYPRTSIIPVSTTDAKYENQLAFNGPKMTGPWPYYAYKDHSYNKLYLPGRNLQVIDFSTLTNNQPTSTIYGQVSFGRTQRLEQSVHTTGNKIYFASYFSGIVSLDRANGQFTDHVPLAGEPITYTYAKARDLVVDNANNLLYSPIFYEPNNVFYGILELNLTTQAKRWITTTSAPVAISSGVANMDDNNYWGGFRIHLDEQNNLFYFSTGNGVWWWNRTSNTTGVISTSGGISLAPGSPNLPSNLTTGMYMDHSENKFYIGTHEGLFVWDRNTNTSRVYNTSNSSLGHNLINTIDKNDELHLIYVACEEGGVFVINTQTGEEKMITEDAGSEVHPQYMDNSAASAYYDEVDKKLYVSADHASGGVWIQDYNNLIPDYGDLRLKAGSPAIDKGNSSFYPSPITTDIGGLNRFVNYVTIEGDNSLDLGAHEKVYDVEAEPNPPIEVSDQNYILAFSPVTEIATEDPLDDFPVHQVNKSITYFDGLGRPMQSIAIQSSPEKHDIITPIVYDELGREPRKYLPFVAGNNGSYRPNVQIIDANHNYIVTEAPTYSDETDNIADDTRPYSQIMFEPSPLNRPDKEYGPGQAWAPSGEGSNNKFIKHEYLSNVHSLDAGPLAEAIIAWTVDESGILVKESPVQGYIASGGYYESAQLHVKVTLDEHENAVREYTNKQGQVVLKKVQAVAKSNPVEVNLNNIDEWACTYYVYDDLGNLRFVLPPEGVKQYLAVAGQN